TPNGVCRYRGAGTLLADVPAAGRNRTPRRCGRRSLLLSASATIGLRGLTHQRGGGRRYAARRDGRDGRDPCNGRHRRIGRGWGMAGGRADAGRTRGGRGADAGGRHETMKRRTLGLLFGVLLGVLLAPAGCALQQQVSITGTVLGDSQNGDTAGALAP